jgi:hypothetical protein
MPSVLKSGSLNLLEPSGPVQACNRIALPLPLLIIRNTNNNQERPPIWRVAVNKLNKQPRTADKGWSSNLGEVLTSPLRKKSMLRITHVEMLPLETKQSGGKLLPHSNLRGGSVSRGSITQPKKLL